VSIHTLHDSSPDREDRVAEMLRVIAGLVDPDDTAPNGRFKPDKREALEQMRQADRDAWASVQLGDPDRQLRSGEPEAWISCADGSDLDGGLSSPGSATKRPSRTSRPSG
jgi:hypothetical protein